ncbi:hypothetical protein ACFT43_16395 [Streptomyces albidoflavus]
MPETPETETAEPGDPASSPDDDAPAAHQPQDAAEPGRGRMRTIAAAALGVVLSTALAAAVTTYFDVWSSSRSPVPAGRALHAESEVWWDLTRDTKAVRIPGTADVAKLEQEAMDAGTALDGLVEADGTYAGMMRVRVTLMNFTKVPVSVTGVRARVTEEKPAAEGDLLSCGGAEGSTGITRLRIDLGASDTAAQEYDGEKAVGQYPTQEMQLAKQDEPAIFDIRVEAGETAASYVLDVVYQQGTEKGRVVVDDGGKPFVLAPDEEDIDSTYRCDDSMTHWRKQP